MDNNDIAVQTLNTMLQRHAKVVQGYEVEIANLTAEIFRLKGQLLDSEEDAEPVS